jgi:3'(2'), 5'-bisphosphate nucleotidase
MKFRTELEHAMRIAKEAGDIILQYYHSDYATYEKDNKSPVTEADLAANEHILAELKKISDIPILSEETKDVLTRMESDWLWIVDPLDGTKDFLNKTGEFSVMIGLSYNSRPLAGVVYQPTTQKSYIAEQGKGAWLAHNGTKTKLHVSRVAQTKDMTVVVSRSHLKTEDKQIAEALHAQSFRQSGSVGIKIGLIAEQEADVYYNISPYTSEWDTCAPEIILEEAGGTMTNIDGTTLLYNQEEVRRLRGIAASNGMQHDTLIQAIASVTHANT